MSKISGNESLASSNWDFNWRKNAKSITKKFGYILEHEEFCDVSFKLMDNEKNVEVVKAHKLVLMTASEVFERMFNGNFRETNQDPEYSVQIADVDLLSFKTMLNFIYTEEMPKQATASQTIRLVNAARKYDIDGLEILCWAYLAEKITVKNCVEIFQAAQLYENKTMEDIGLKFLINNFETLLDTNEFLNLSNENIRMLLTVENICVDTELQVFNAIVRWSAAKCREQSMNVTPANQRIVLGEVINLINFTEISPADIALTVVPSELLTYEEFTLLFQHLNVPTELLDQLPELPFSTICRQRETKDAWFQGAFQQPKNCSNDFQIFAFLVNKNIKIVGFGLHGNSETTTRYLVTLRFVDGPTDLEISGIENKVVIASNSMLRVDLVEPVEIIPNHKYVVAFKIVGPPIPWLKNNELNSQFQHGVKFTLQPNRLVIPQIRFKIK